MVIEENISKVIGVDRVVIGRLIEES